MAMIDNLNWRCFIALEEELVNTQNFVEIHKSNYKTFSIKYRSIIMQACSEIEIIYKKVCGIDHANKADMKTYRDFIKNNHHQDFFNIEVLIPIYNEKLKPWFVCAEDRSPEFWSAYNTIKHQGKLEEATLENAISSLADLFSLLLLWYFKSHGREFSGNEAISLPKLFNYPGLSPTFIVTEDSHNIKIPGFEAVKELA